ncbi:MAG: hypothetical protein RIT04_177 [Candidatus Parcubacteria bacterium]|jgi:hypothetical protein
MTSITFDAFQLILVFVSVICGVVAAVYFYLSTDIFQNLLKRPLRLIASGMIIMTFGVMIAEVISFESQVGIILVLYGIPLQAFFYAAYIIGSCMILIGARQFSTRPKVKLA